MAKNPRRQQKKDSASPAPIKSTTVAVVSNRGKKLIGLGAFLVFLGFGVLTQADPAGQNWASTVSPALLVLGYALFGVGIVLPDPRPRPDTPT